MSVNFEQLDTSGLATTEEVDALINDSEASGQSTYSSAKIDEDYQQKDSDISGGTVQYVASSSGNAPASGSMLGNIIGWLVGKCNGIGNISNLLTVAKSNLVAAINELRGEIGDLTQLDTTEKTDLVAAINKINSKTLNGTKVTLVEYDATTSIVSKTLPKPISSFKALLIRAKCTRTDGSAENLYNYLPVATLDNWWFQSNNTNRLYYNFERQGETESARGWVTPQGDSQMAFHCSGRGIVFYVYGLE